MHIQPFLIVKVWRLWWSCWTSLAFGPLWAQTAPYFFQCQEQHWTVCRLPELSDTAGLSAWESEALLPRFQSVLRQWYDQGAQPTLEWHFQESIDPHDAWRQPLQRLRWSPSGISWMQRGEWVALLPEEAPESLDFPESLLLPRVSQILPSTEELAALGALQVGDGRWSWEAGEGWTLTAQANPPEWTWAHGDGRVERWEFAPLGAAWYIHVEERVQPRILSSGACAQEWTWVLRSPLDGFDGEQATEAELQLSPNPHDLGEVWIALSDGRALQPSSLEFRDVQGRVAWALEETGPLPLYVQPTLAPGRYTAVLHFGPFSLQAPFVQL